MRRILSTALVAVAALVAVSAATAAPSPSYQLTAVGTGTQFVGVAVGSAGDRGAFRATVAPGGAFSFRSGAGQLDGSFDAAAMTARPAAACGTQLVDVSGTLVTHDDVFDFTGVLTQIRVRLLGQCRTLAQTLQGTLSESIGQF